MDADSSWFIRAIGTGERIVILFDGQGILLDIEGTTSSISFVYDVLFAHARKHLETFLQEQISVSSTVQKQAAALACETGLELLQIDASNVSMVARAAADLMARDVKSTPLKALQGMIWRRGYESGELVSHLFEDVPRALDRWTSSGLDVRIYSSGSIEAQQLFFGHTAYGDVTPLFSGYYDTTTGSKRETMSYSKISDAMQIEPRQILFVSDIGAELDAAKSSGMATALADRPGNVPGTSVYDHPMIRSFDDIIS